MRRTIEAAGAQYQASIEDQRDVMVTLFAEVVLNYVKIREFQQRIAVARANSRGQQESLKLAQDKFIAGISSKLDVTQAQYNLANTQATVPPLEIGKNQALNRLAVLLDQAPGSLNRELAEEKPLPAQQSNLGIGVPADVLRQRPDIRRAERQLAAQTALVGVATAGLYPDFSLSGFIGFQSKKTSDFFNSDSLTWGIGLPVEWTLFDGGRIRSNIEIQDERAEQNLLSYQKAVLTALAEVENAVVAINQDAIQRNLLTQATQAGIEAVRLVLIQYDTGITDFNNVLTTQRDLFLQQEQLVRSEARFVIDYIQLYKALGGGWDIAATETTGP